MSDRPTVLTEFFSPFLNLFRAKKLLLTCFFPLLVLVGLLSSKLSIICSVGILVFLVYHKRYSDIIILLFFVLILGDSRNSFLQFFKDLRIVLVLGVGGIAFFLLRKEFLRFLNARAVNSLHGRKCFFDSVLT